MNKSLQILNIIGFIGIIVMNVLAITLPLGGQTTGELSAMYPSLFTPAGFTFSIWSIIYLGLLIFTIIQAKGLFSTNQTAPSFVSQIGNWFFLNALCNMAWLFVWHFQYVGLSVVIMFGILITLIVIYNCLQIGIVQPPSALVRWGVHVPFQVYLGWISIATIANISTFLVDINWNGWELSEVFWTVAMISIGAGLGIWMLLRRGDIFYNLVLIWAFYGIYAKRSTTDPVLDSIIVTSLVAIGTLVVLSLVSRLWFKPRYIQ